MKKLWGAAALLAMTALLASCGGGKEKAKTVSDEDISGNIDYQFGVNTPFH